MRNEYWVCAGREYGAALGLISFLRASLPDPDGKVAVVASEGEAEVFFAAGAHKIYRTSYASEGVLARRITRLCQQHSPVVILFPATVQLRQTAAQVSAMMGCGLCADCTGLEFQEDRRLVMRRPAYGEHLIADILCRPGTLQMATVRPGAYLPSHIYESTGKTVLVDDRPEHDVGDVISLLEEIPIHQEPLSSAQIIVAGGRGIGKEGFAKLKDLSRLMGASLGASRAAVNAGYVPYEHQVGLTGAIVHPKIYVAVGISGAVQHLVGMTSSDYIVAINSDPKAPIFMYSDLALVSPWEPAVEELIQHFQ